MKKILTKKLCVLFIFLLIIGTADAQYGSYAQLTGDKKSILFQIKPDRNYTNVSAYISFFSQDGGSIRKNVAYPVTDNSQKYILKDKITYKTFPCRYQNVASIKINYVVWSRAAGKADETREKINLPIRTSPLK